MSLSRDRATASMNPDAQRMSGEELRAATGLAGVFGLRMLGLFLILPVFAVHARGLAGGEDLTLVGLALGAYGLSQAILQLPFGMASDRWGRKPLIYLGLIVFACGSLVAAAATDIWITILGRALQGAGAVSSVVIALAADLTREQHRTKTMAMIGASIGGAFALSLVAAPLLYPRIGMAGLFVLTAALSVAAIAVVRTAIPDPLVPATRPRSRGTAALGEILRHPELLRLNFGIFVLHAVQMAMFVVVPQRLVDAGLALDAHWQLYLPVVLASFVVMLPAILHADQRHRARPILIGAVALLVAVQAGFATPAAHSVTGLALLLLAFFVAFNVLEALIPSLVTRRAPPDARGTASGVYNTTQTLGLFFGGLMGGVAAQHLGPDAVYAAGAVLAGVWLVAALGMRREAHGEVNGSSILTFSVPERRATDDLAQALRQVRGVLDVQVLDAQHSVRLRVGDEWDEASARALLAFGGSSPRNPT